MTFEQLRIFLEVAEREHLSRAAQALHLTPSAVSAAVRTLEASYGVTLFHRVGRGIELSETGRLFLPEARAILARAASAAAMLSDLGNLRRGRLALHASQTTAGHFLPPFMVRFHDAHPGIALDLVIGNTESVAAAVIAGEADLGFVEGPVDSPLLAAPVVAEDRLIVVVAPGHPLAAIEAPGASELRATRWIMREVGSGTRASFVTGIAAEGLGVDDLDVALTLPSNEAVLAAVASGPYATAVSEAAAGAMIAAGELVHARVALPPRAFRLLRHKERHRTAAAAAFEALVASGGGEVARAPLSNAVKSGSLAAN